VRPEGVRVVEDTEVPGRVLAMAEKHGHGVYVNYDGSEFNEMMGELLSHASKLSQATVG